MIKNYNKTDIGELFWCDSNIYRYENHLLFRRYISHTRQINHSYTTNRVFRWDNILGVEKDLVLSEFFSYKSYKNLKGL